MRLHCCWPSKSAFRSFDSVISVEWDEFDGTSRLWTLLDGVANVDELACPTRGWSGRSVGAA